MELMLEEAPQFAHKQTKAKDKVKITVIHVFLTVLETHSLHVHEQPLQCLRVLTLSSWNPPPGNRKMHGDLMYLNLLTLEDKEVNITASTRGFYLNQ